MEDKIKKILEEYKVYGVKQDLITEELLVLFNVSQQRELLIAFHEFLQTNYCHHLFDSEKIKVIEEFEATNCG